MTRLVVGAYLAGVATWIYATSIRPAAFLASFLLVSVGLALAFFPVLAAVRRATG